MRLLHLHCSLLLQLYTCPVLFGLMLLHIFLILPVITDCTGWYSFPPVLSIGSHTVSAYIPAWYTACYMAVRETSGWPYAPYPSLYGYFGYLPQPHSGYLLFCSILQSIWWPVMIPETVGLLSLEGDIFHWKDTFIKRSPECSLSGMRSNRKEG